MPKYLVKGSYSTTGTQGLLKEGGTSRKTVVEKLVANLGGSVESFYYAFGDPDVYVIVDLPDNITAASVSLAINATGAVGLSTQVLLSPEDVDKATQKTVEYRAPGA